MNKELKNRSGSQSNESKKNTKKGDQRRDNLPGAPSKSSKQTDHERDNSSKGAKKNTTKKQQNSI